MKPTTIKSITAALAAVTLAGSLPGVAFARQGRSNDWGDRRDQGNHYGWDKRDNRNDRDNRNARNNDSIWDRLGNRDNWDNRNNRNDRDDWRYQDSQEARNRQKTKNDWRNLATAAGGIAVIGLLKKDPRIVFGGLAGGLYSLNRYEQDRKSQSQADRARASVFSQPYFYRDGQRYERREIVQNGERYYRFERR